MDQPLLCHWTQLLSNKSTGIGAVIWEDQPNCEKGFTVLALKNIEVSTKDKYSLLFIDFLSNLTYICKKRAPITLRTLRTLYHLVIISGLLWMKKNLLIHFWFGGKDRTCGLTYSGFRDIFQEINWRKSKGRREKNSQKCSWMLIQSP